MKNKTQTKGTIRFLSFKEVEELTGMSRSTIYRQVKRGDFPQPRMITDRKVGFIELELEHWMQGRELAS